MILLAVVAYLTFAFTGWLAVVKYFTMPHYDSDYGLDLSYCEAIWMAVFALLPPGTLSMNLFWFWVLRQHLPRPLIKWPKCKLPTCKLPKCRIAIHAKERK